jgi:hypothetical protein
MSPHLEKTMENLTKSVNLGWNASRVVALAMVMGTVACGSMEQVSSESGESLSTQGQELSSVNGMTLNGMTLNGMTLNGMTLNGMTLNGMTLNGMTLNGLGAHGLGTVEFATWFRQDVELSEMLMRYTVRCAVAAGEARSYQDSISGTTYTWQGSFGLTPSWASGQPINEAEQQLISACLAAHVNKFGVHVPLSVLGRTAQMEPIAYSAEELQAFPRREACFFGNLFTGEGIFAGADRGSLFDGESSPRACGLTTAANVSTAVCAPMAHVQNCEAFCTLDPSGLFYTECNYNGRTYLPVTTRIRSEDVYTCGDGVCQFTESCGTGTVAESCASDCGSCT